MGAFSSLRVFALAACVALLAPPVRAECDDCLLKCWACDPSVYGHQNCTWASDPISTSVNRARAGCFPDNSLYTFGHNMYDEMPDGMRFLGYAWAYQCGFLNCGFCGDDEDGTPSCHAKYGKTLPSGEIVLGSCDTMDDTRSTGSDYCSLDQNEKRVMESEAYYTGDFPFMDPGVTPLPMDQIPSFSKSLWDGKQYKPEDRGEETDSKISMRTHGGKQYRPEEESEAKIYMRNHNKQYRPVGGRTGEAARMRHNTHQMQEKAYGGDDWHKDY